MLVLGGLFVQDWLEDFMSRFVATSLAVVAFSMGVARAQCPGFAPEFTTDGVIGGVEKLAVYDGGAGAELYAARGQMTAAGDAVTSGIARWDGTRWSDVGGGLTATSGVRSVWDLRVHDDGSGAQLYVGGRFDLAGATPAANLARWNGANWSPVGAGPGATVNSLLSANLGNGFRLYAGVPANNTPGVKRWDGASWTNFGGNLAATTVTAMAAWNGELFVSATQVLRSSGGAWTNAHSGLTGVVYALEVLDDGSGPKLYAAGAQNVWTWNGASWLALGSLPELEVHGLSVVDTGGGPALHAVGYDWLITGVNPPVEVVRRWNGSTWTRVGGAHTTTGVALAIAEYDDGNGAATYVGGAFGSLQGDTAQCIARWDGAHWRPLGSGSGLRATEFSPDVQAFASYQPPGAARPWVVAAGRFARAGDQDARNVAAWTGTRWDTLAGGVGAPSHTVYAACVYDEPDPAPPALFAGGDFLPSSGGVFAGIARYDGGAWSKVGAPAGGVGGTARALLVHDDGSGAGPCLFVGGSFALVNGNIPATNVARWNGVAWQALGNGLNSAVFGLALYDDPHIVGGEQLYALGQFTASGAAPMSKVARWDGAAWSTVGFPGAVSQTRALAWDAGQGLELFVGGEADSFVRRWNGLAWSTVSPLYLGLPMAVFDDGAGEQLYFSTRRWDGIQFATTPIAFSHGGVVDEGEGRSALWFRDFGVEQSTICAGVGRYSNPCAVLTSYCTAKTNSQGCVPALTWSGAPSATSGAPFAISATQMINNKLGILFYGANGRRSAPFFGGTLCVQPPSRRTAAQSSGGNAGPDDCSGAYSFDFNAWIAAGLDTALFAGVRIDAQFWQRDPASVTGPVGLSEGIEFEIAP